MKILLILLFTSAMLFSKTISSQENKVSLIELYTSQGCSSCPPADLWLNDLKKDTNLFKTFIPMAYHVTYWNFLGWKDVFSKKQYDKRQKNYSNNIWKKNSVYTPQFIVDAKEYRKWFSNQEFPLLKNEYAGVLSVDIKEKSLLVTYDNKNKDLNKKVFLNLVILKNNLFVKIKSGENKNKLLEHNFVVKELITYNKKIINGKLNTTINYKIKKDSEILVLFLSDENGKQIQALGSYL